MTDRICVIDGCGRPADEPGCARGWCHYHYARWHEYGDPLEPLRRTRSWEGQVCSIDGCDKPVYGRGLCEPHAAKRRRAADPAGQRERQRRWKARREAEMELAAGRPRASVCELCGQPARTVWDHCHATGRFRGWLCDRCNRVLGSVGDSIDLLAAMIDYLRRSDGSEQAVSQDDSRQAQEAAS